MQLFENPSQPPFAKGRNNIPLSGFSLPQAGKRGIKGDFMVTLRISLSSKLLFSKT